MKNIVNAGKARGQYIKSVNESRHRSIQSRFLPGQRVKRRSDDKVFVVKEHTKVSFRLEGENGLFSPNGFERV